MTEQVIELGGENMQSSWVGVLSDTHIPKRASALPPQIFKILEGASLIIHAGDLVKEDILLELEALASVFAVSGNMDPLPLYHKLGEEKTLNLSGLKLGLTHGKGRGEYTKEWVFNRFVNQCQGAVFGHLHSPVLEYRGNFLLFNPGSPTVPRGQAAPSCGKLWVENGKLKGEIIEIT